LLLVNVFGLERAGEPADDLVHGDGVFVHRAFAAQSQIPAAGLGWKRRPSVVSNPPANLTASPHF